MVRLFFATDVHGSTKCWKKFINAGAFYKVDYLILGGDMTGKAVIPIMKQNDGSYRVTFLENEYHLRSEEDLENMKRMIEDSGYYPYITDPQEIEEFKEKPKLVDDLFYKLMIKRLESWIEFAEKKLKNSKIPFAVVCPGNDDPFVIDEVLRKAEVILDCEGQKIEIKDKKAVYEMVCTGWTNPTPWNTHREEPEEKLRERIEKLVSEVNDVKNAIFNFHAPPYGSTLDEAPELDENLRPKYGGQVLKPVGSYAVKEAIEKYQPLLGLHGHIHEGRGTINIGRTLCVNPGSSYEQGILQGIIIELDKGKVKRHILTSG